MSKYYLRTISLEKFIQDMLAIGIDLSGWNGIDIISLPGYVFDWIGYIPYPLTAEQEAENIAAFLDGQLPIHMATYRPDFHVNVLTKDTELNTAGFENTFEKFPAVPYRTFAE